MCVDHIHWGITTIPKNGMLGVTELSYHFWYDIHTSFFTVHGPCSEAGPFPQLLNNSTRLSVAENSHNRLDEPYLIAGSQKNYTLAISDSTTSDLDPDSCIAKVHIFTDNNHYNQFIASGHVAALSVSECFSPVQPLTLSLPPTTTDKQDMYYFIGVESRYPSTLNVTVASNILEYSTTALSETTCNFSIVAPTCTIPLHHENDEELCVLASLMDTDSFTPVGYSAPPPKVPIEKIIHFNLTLIIFPICGLLIIICTLLIMIFLLKSRSRKLPQITLHLFEYLAS